MDHFRSIVSRLSGGGTPAIDKALQQHHDQVFAEAQRHSANAKSWYSKYMAASRDGKDPTTGQPVTPDVIAKWKANGDAEMAEYGKIAGKSKQAKPLVQQMAGAMKHVIAHHDAQTGQPGQPETAASATAAPAPPTQQGQPTVPPPPQGAAPPSPQSGTVPPPPQGAPTAASASSPSASSPSNPFMDAAQRDSDAAATKDQDTLRMETAKSDIEAKGKGKAETATITGMADGLKAEGFTPEQIHEVLKSKYGGAGLRSAAKMHPLKVMDPNDPTKTIPALQSTVADENGQYPVYDSTGNVIGNPSSLVPGMLETQRVGEMPVYNPATNQIEQQPTYSRSHKVAPAASAASLSGGSGAASSSKARPGAVAPPPSSKSGRHGIPVRNLSTLAKPATSIDEARNSLIGDDPAKIGGLAADLDIFKSPESVRKVGEYLELVNAQMANEAKDVAGHGAVAALEWYTGLPQAVIGLQQGALREKSQSLTPQEQRFVADYYRVLGTIGGMRAATGASAAQWSFNALKAELPTPGPVTDYGEAKRRIGNYVRETNVAAKRNPLSQQVDPKKLDQLDGGGGGGGDVQPPGPAKPNMKWQHRTVDGKTEWRQVAK